MVGRAEEDLVNKARVEGWSWFGIAEALGRSRQAVWEKYQRPHRSEGHDPRLKPEPPEPRQPVQVA